MRCFYVWELWSYCCTTPCLKFLLYGFTSSAWFELLYAIGGFMFSAILALFWPFVAAVDPLTLCYPLLVYAFSTEILWLSSWLCVSSFFSEEWWPNTLCLKLLKATITTVTLSSDRLNREFLRMYSTPIPHILCTSVTWPFTLGWFLLSKTAFHTQWETSVLFILSKIPSHPRTIKSCSRLIWNDLTSGVWITTPYLPPRAGILASGSPNVLATESLPGRTLRGPARLNCWYLSIFSLLYVIIWFVAVL